MPPPGRLTVFCQDVPYPPTHGGRLDLWNLLRGLHHHGMTLQLVCWFKQERMAPEIRHELARVAADIVEVPLRGGWWRLFYAKYPPRMLAFAPSRHEYAQLKRHVETFDPDWLLLDHWFGSLTVRTLSKELARPFVYRSQNVEHRYNRELAYASRGLARIKFGLNALPLFAAERELRTSADVVADISAVDTDEWRKFGGAGNALVVPPLWLDPLVPASQETERDIDLLFVGNLLTANNVEGLRWFTTDVLPLLRRRMATPAPRIVFAGSRPAASDLAFWREAGIHCEANPPSVSMFYARARVVINPVQRASGVNLKMIEAFASCRPVVATRAAARGLPDAVSSQFQLCDTADVFASEAHSILTSKEIPVDPVQRAILIDRYFGFGNVVPLIRAMGRTAGETAQQHAAAQPASGARTPR